MIADITLIHNTHFIAPRLPKLIKSWEYCSDIHFFLQTKKIRLQQTRFFLLLYQIGTTSVFALISLR